MRAIHTHRISLAERLIMGNVGLRTRDVKGNNCLHVAAKYGSLELIDKLRKYLDVNATNNKLYPPLYYAIKKRRPEVVQYLVDNGAATEFYFPYRNKSLTPLDFAKVIKAPNCVQILNKKKDQLERSVSINLSISKGLVEYQVFDKLVIIRIETSLFAIEFPINKEEDHYISTMQSLAKGSYYHEVGNFVEAGNQFLLARKSLISARGAQHYSVVALLCIIADCFHHQSKFDEASVKYLELLNFLSENPKQLLQTRGDCLLNIGACYFKQQNYVEARDHFNKALKLFKKISEDLYLYKPRCLALMGLCYYKEQKYDEAMQQFYEALNLTQKRLQECLYGRGNCFFFIGACFLMKENYVEARCQLSEALQCFTRIEEEAPEITSTVTLIELCNKKIHGSGWFWGLSLTQVVAFSSIACLTCSPGFGIFYRPRPPPK